MRWQLDILSANPLIAVLCIILLPCFARATPPDEFPFRRLSVEDGLSQSAVNAITQDARGLLWFGTQDGLNQYDGNAFTVYRNNPGDSSSLSDNHVTALLVDRSGQLWIGTYAGGICRLDPGASTFLRFPHERLNPNSPAGNSIMALAEDSSGNIWAGTWLRGLSRYNPRDKSWSHYIHRQDSTKLPDDRVMSVAVDQHGRLWAGTWGGVAFYNASEDRLVAVPESPAMDIDRRVFCVYPDRTGRVWFGTLEGGLGRVDVANLTISRYAGDKAGSMLESKMIRAMITDDDGTLWVGTQDAGINRLDPAKGMISLKRNGPPSAASNDHILSFFRDREGGIWAGVDGRGVNHYDPLRIKFQHIRQEPGSPTGLANPVVRALCEDRQGRLWIGTMGDGLDCFDPRRNRWTHYPFVPRHPGIVSSGDIMALVEDTKGYLWVGTSGAGIDRLDPSRKRAIHLRIPRVQGETIGPDFIMTMLESRDGTLWIGTTGGGVAELNPTTLKARRYLAASRGAVDAPASNYVYALMEDRRGRIWIGTWGAGISVLDRATEQFAHLEHIDSLPSSLAHNTIQAFHEDARGTVWIGTAGGGLDAFNPSSGTFEHFIEADGLPNNVVYGILEDAEGNLWLSTNKGICRFDPQSRTMRNFTTSDGLQSLEFNQGAYLKGRDGRLYFGGINGFNIIDPAGVPIDTVPPPVLITQCTIFNDPVPITQSGTLDLPHDQNYISFEFVALDFTAPERNQYRYMLEGFDRSWTESGRRRFASYTNLPSGEYVFRVRGSNGDGTWSRQDASLTIRIASPYWERAWFRGGILALAVAALSLAYRANIRRLQKEQRLQSEFSRKLNESQETVRKRIAGELHDGLGQELLAIKSSIDHLAGEAPSPGNLKDVSDAVQQAIEDVREISADLHPHMLERLGLTRTVKATIRRVSEATGLDISATVDSLDNLFTPFEEINIYRILQEAFNNIVRHSHASQCRVRVTVANGNMVMEVTDDGCGFEAENARTSSDGGLGLVNMAERVRILDGDMDIESAPGKGTSLRFRIPLKGGSGANA